MTPSEFRQFIVSWVSLALPGTLIIRRNENGTRPPLPYLDYIVGTKTQVGQAQRQGTDINGDTNVKVHKDVVISIRGYGDAAEDLLDTLSNSLELDSVRSLFQLNCVANRGEALPVTQIPRLLDETIERRFLYEPIFGYAQEVTENVSYIETVDPILENSTINPPC